jgi:hypothetical protein
MFANTQMGGMSLGFPDVCLTPIPSPAGPIPTPLPYPNIAMGMMGVPAVYNVLFGGAPAENLLTMSPMSSGNEAGAMGGVASCVIIGPDRYILGSFKVVLGGVFATRMTSPTIQNSTNCPGISLVPAQVRVMLFS